MDIIKPYTRFVFRGLGQIMLQGNAITGLLFALGIAIHSLGLAGAAILGAVIGTLWAKLCKYPVSAITAGLYGFNSALVAIGVSYFYSFSTLTLGLLVCGGIFATWIMHVMQTYQLKPYTFPFVLTLWLIFAIVPQHVMGLPLVTLGTSNINGVLQGFGQVMFQSNSWTGLVFILAIFVNNTKNAIWAVAAATLAMIVAFLLHWSNTEIVAGMYSYNAVLAALAVLLLTPQKWLWVLAILLSILLTKLMFILSLPALTFPFILAIWCVAWGIHFYPNQQTNTENCS